jgi:hypothetical protein
MSEEVVEQIEEAVQQAPADAEEALKDIAASMGWHDKEGGKTPAEFIRDTADINRSLRSKVDNLNDKIEQLAISESKRTIAALKDQKARLQKEFDEAVEAGDKEAASKAATAMGELAEETPVRSDVQRVWQTHAEQFMAANAAALNDPLARIEAKELIDKMANNGSTPEETYAAATRKLKRDYPEHYMNSNRDRPSKVNGDGAPVNSGGKSQWKALMKEAPEAEQVFANFVRSGVYKDTPENREKYAKQVLES